MILKEINKMANVKNSKICVIGLGYVGLPLAHAFSEKYKVVGFDISQWRIDELSSGYDRTLELNETQVKEAIKNVIDNINPAIALPFPLIDFNPLALNIIPHIVTG